MDKKILGIPAPLVVLWFAITVPVVGSVGAGVYHIEKNQPTVKVVYVTPVPTATPSATLTPTSLPTPTTAVKSLLRVPTVTKEVSK